MLRVSAFQCVQYNKGKKPSHCIQTRLLWMYQVSFTFYTAINASGGYQPFFLIDHCVLCKPVANRMENDVWTKNIVVEIHTRFSVPPCVGVGTTEGTFTQSTSINKSEILKYRYRMLVQLVLWMADCQTLKFMLWKVCNVHSSAILVMFFFSPTQRKDRCRNFRPVNERRKLAREREHYSMTRISANGEGHLITFIYKHRGEAEI